MQKIATPLTQQAPEMEILCIPRRTQISFPKPSYNNFTNNGDQLRNQTMNLPSWHNYCRSICDKAKPVVRLGRKATDPPSLTLLINKVSEEGKPGCQMQTFAHLVTRLFYWRKSKKCTKVKGERKNLKSLQRSGKIFLFGTSLICLTWIGKKQLQGWNEMECKDSANVPIDKNINLNLTGITKK